MEKSTSCFCKMFKCAAVLLLAAVAVSTAVPIGTRFSVYDNHPFFGNIYDLVKEHQMEDQVELNDEHTLEQMQLMAGQNVVRDLLYKQQEEVQENKEVLDRLNQVRQMVMQKEKEMLQMMQWWQKLQLGKIHAIQDAKISGYGYPAINYGGNLSGMSRYEPFNVVPSSLPYIIAPYFGIIGGI